MLVTDVGGLSEIVPDGICGYVVKPLPEAIAESINDFFANNRSEEFTEGVREVKGKFTWDKLTESITISTIQLNNFQSHINSYFIYSTLFFILLFFYFYLFTFIFYLSYMIYRSKAPLRLRSAREEAMSLPILTFMAELF